MHSGAIEYVDWLCRSRDARRLIANERLILRAIAQCMDPATGVACARVATLASKGMQSVSTAQRMLARLQHKGLVEIFPTRLADGSCGASEYEFPAVRAGIGVASSQRVPRVPRQRVVGPAALRALPPPRRANTRDAQGDGAPGELAGLAVASTAVENAAGMRPGVVSQVRPGVVSHVRPLEVFSEVVFEVSPPPSPCPRAADGGKRGGPAFPEQGERPRATARATATATTSGVRAAEVRGERGGDPGTSGRAGRPECQEDNRRLSREQILPKKRVPRDAEAERRGLDGLDAALWDEAMRVLRACGCADPTRRERAAVVAALGLYVQQQQSTPAQAGDHAVWAWAQYVGLGALLRGRVGWRRFFHEGLWRTPARWDVDSRAAARTGEAQVGLWRG